MNNSFKSSEEEKNNILRIVQNSELFECHEIEILQALAEKFNIMNLADAAKFSNKTYNGIKKRINQSKEVTVNLNGYQFISVN